MGIPKLTLLYGSQILAPCDRDSRPFAAWVELLLPPCHPCVSPVALLPEIPRLPPRGIKWEFSYLLKSVNVVDRCTQYL